MYRRAFPKLHHRRAATCPIGFLASSRQKRATHCSPSDTAVEQSAILSKRSGKDTAPASPVGVGFATKDIIIDDLQATLEAHRATNRASVVRTIIRDVPETAPLESGIYRPPLTQPLDHNVELEHEAAGAEPVKEVSQFKKLGASLWPADSIQGQRVLKEQLQKGCNTWEENDGEYIGTNFRPQGYWHVRFARDYQRPWLAHIEGHDGDGLARLEDEIRAYESYMSATAAEKLASQLLIQEVTSIVGEALPNNPLELVGSRRTGLATPTSDIDFTVSIPKYDRKGVTARGPSPGRPKARKARERIFYTLRDALVRSQQFVDVRFVYARVPIVTGLHRHTGLKVDFQSLAPTLAARTCVAAYLSEYPTLRPLYTLLRSALAIRHLNTVFEGGLGSYTILMMIVNALKHASLPSSTGYGITRHDLGAQLFWVLDFYATADLRRNGYSPDPPGVFPKAEGEPVRGSKHNGGTGPTRHETDTIFKQNPQKPYLLCLQDPADPTNDLGRSSYGIKHVQETFRKTSTDMKRALRLWDKTDPENRKVQFSLLDALVGAYYGQLEQSRKNIERAAAEAKKKGWNPHRPSRVPIQLVNFERPNRKGLKVRRVQPIPKELKVRRVRRDLKN
ncbi:MAG: hypothetical protein FRX48_02628 [Lasallia pustulata]|uniref:Poly(A) RNA polymerase mitochondrial-like central palm domain-containing protein n=1 Tax=Lasallia pustulata TaxID=136370 RepID=A0A5M8PX73_9LECA|nr:MAG: hypothetical protein FRX48_02628 [Lasallia pustulata]